MHVWCVHVCVVVVVVPCQTSLCVCGGEVCVVVASNVANLCSVCGNVQGLKASKFKQLCSWGRHVYRWSAMSYSCLQLYQNPWLVQAVLTAIWTFSRVSMKALR